MAENKDLDWAAVLTNLAAIAPHVIGQFPGWIQSEIDDIVNETATKLWRLGIREPSKKLSYIMLRQAAIDRWRARRRQRPLSGIDVVDHREGRSADADRRQDLWNELQRALAGISEEDQQLLLRFYCDRVEIKQLAIEAGVNYSAMAVRLHRVKNRLRDQIVRPHP